MLETGEAGSYARVVLQVERFFDIGTPGDVDGIAEILRTSPPRR